ncbi:MAG: nitrilase family protein [Bacteroidales bacterium]|nr:nitrilase family protein [Bacteroidales bacterium]
MNITLYQQDIVWLDAEANYRKMEQVLQQTDTDLLVLPEMCTSGFIKMPLEGQIETSEEVEKRLLALSNRYQTAICGSFAVSTPTGNRNRCYFVTPEGNVSCYDKHHLFRPGMEDKGYRAGKDFCVVSWRGIRFMLAVCYDLRFPAWTRYRDSLPYDVLICVANWPDKRQLAWDVLLRARAIENQAYCVGVNRVGHDMVCTYQGGSCAIHPYGHPVAECKANEEGVCTFSPDMEKLMSYRQKFPSLGDADEFCIFGVSGS